MERCSFSWGSGSLLGCNVYGERENFVPDYLACLGGCSPEELLT